MSYYMNRPNWSMGQVQEESKVQKAAMNIGTIIVGIGILIVLYLVFNPGKAFPRDTKGRYRRTRSSPRPRPIPR